ncbi:MAG: hypothetical protein M1820_007824 [Bogoriella megaspora]|nr:MAG: hypothetical protein M1820_007824 [Bogoriella megaspora]
MATKDRKEKRLMRQRGTGAREMKNATFGFTFGNNIVERPARETPQAQLSSNAATTRFGRGSHETPKNNSKTPGPSVRPVPTSTSTEHNPGPIASLFVTPNLIITGKRKRPNSIAQAGDDEPDELGYGDNEQQFTYASHRANRRSSTREVSHVEPVAETTVDVGDKERWSPHPVQISTDLSVNGNGVSLNLEADDELRTLGAVDELSVLSLDRAKTPAPPQQLAPTDAVSGMDERPLTRGSEAETPVSFSVEAKYIPRKSYQRVGKLKLPDKVMKAKEGKAVKKATEKVALQQEHGADKPNDKEYTEKAAQELHGDQSAANLSNSGHIDDQSAAVVRKKFHQTISQPSGPSQAPVAVMTSTQRSISDLGELSTADFRTIAPRDDSDASRISMGPPSELRSRAVIAVVTASEPSPSPSMVNFTPPIVDEDDNGYAPNNSIMSITSNYPAPKPTKKRKQLSSSAQSMGNLRTRVSPSKRYKSNSDAVPVTIYRITAPSQSLHDFDSDSDSEDLASHEAASSHPSNYQKSAPNAIDVLAQITTELLDARASVLHAAATKPNKKKKDKKLEKERAALIRQRNSVLQFQQELEERFFVLTEAVDANRAVTARLKDMLKRKVGLREKLLEVKRKREEVQVKVDEIRSGHLAKIDRERERRALEEGLQGIVIAVARGRERVRREGYYGTIEVAPQTQARRLAELIGNSEGSGLVEKVKRLNQTLGKTIEV